MWISFLLVAITCAASAFMIGFVVALLRESSPRASKLVISVARRERAGSLHTDNEDALVLDDGSVESRSVNAGFEEWRDKCWRDDGLRVATSNRLRPEQVAVRWRIERTF
jgi:hypothetical protein